MPERISLRSRKNPPFESDEAVAARLHRAFWYTDAISADSRSQSRTSSCRMQRQSIHRYRAPTARVHTMASSKVLESGGICFKRLARLVVLSLKTLGGFP